MPGLEDLYREIILDHYRHPRNRGELPVPPAHTETGYNPLCGDEITLYLRVEDGMVADLTLTGQGCSISQASASMMSTAVKGKPIEEAHQIVRAFKAMMSLHVDGTGGEGGVQGEETTRSGNGQVKLGDLEALRGVVKFPIRIKCATLSWNTLIQLLDEAA